jgi:hypothetical protein
MWRADGGELLYLGPAGEVMAVLISRNGEGWTFGKPVRLSSLLHIRGFDRLQPTH